MVRIVSKPESLIGQNGVEYRGKEKMLYWLRKDRLITIKTIFFIAFMLRLAFVLLLNPTGYYFSDTRHYDRAAMSLLNGEGLGEKYYRAPLYPVVMAAVYGTGGHSFVIMRLVEVAMGMLLCWMVYRLALQLYGARAAKWSVLFAAVFPHFIMLVGILYPTNLFTLLIVSTLYFLIQSDRESFFWPTLLSAVLAGLAMLTVASLFFMVPFWLFWLLKRRGPSGWKSALLFMITFLIVMAPWTLRNYNKYGRLTLGQPLPHTVLPNLQDREQQEIEIASGFQTTVNYFKEHPAGTSDDALVNTFLHYLRHPFETIKHLAAELCHFWAFYPDRLDSARDAYRAKVHAKDSRMENRGEYWRWIKWPSIMVMAPVFLLALLGLKPAITSNPRATWLLILSIASFSVGYSMIYAEVRYRIPVEPFVLMFTALGWGALLHRLQRNRLSAHS